LAKIKNTGFLRFFALGHTDFWSVCHFAESLAELGFDRICAKSAFLPYIHSPYAVQKHAKFAENLGGLDVGVVFGAFRNVLSVCLMYVFL